MADVLAGKRLQVLKESIPKLSHVAVLWNPSSSDNQPQWKESQLAARQLGLQLHSMEVNTTDQYESAFKEAIKARSAALAVSRHRLFTNYQKRSPSWRPSTTCRRFTFAKTLLSAGA